MPLFVKCGNPQCFCFGQFQLRESDHCQDCGLPFGQGTNVYIVICNGPEPKEFHIERALNADHAASLALEQIEKEGLNPNHFRITNVYTPDQIPTFDDAA